MLPEQPRPQAGQRPILPTAIHPPAPAVTEARAVVWVPDAYGQLVPMLREQAPPSTQPSPPRDLTPKPLIDPIAQRLGCAAVLAVGIGIGGWLLFTPWAAVCLGSVAVIVVAFRLPAARRGGDVHVHQRGGAFSRNTTNIN